MNLRLATILTTRVAADATAQEVADALFKMTMAIDTALVPTLEATAVKQLFEHTLAVGAKTHPWMSVGCQSYGGGIHLDALRVLFSQQTSVEAADGANLFLRTFYDSLAVLIGDPLSERLLRPVRFICLPDSENLT